MKPKEVRKLLNCSYTAIQNWVKQGKLRYSEYSSKRHDYEDESVYKLYDEMFGTKKMDNVIVIGLKNQKYEFRLTKEIVEDVLDFINQRLKR